MKILVAGYGFVGRAHESLLRDKHDVTIYDPPLDHNPIIPEDLESAIICVSTPQGSDGECNVNNVINVIDLLPKNMPILIKSTISLEGWRKICFMYPHHVLAFSPEFLRAATAVEDFYNTRTIYIGGKGKTFWHALFRFAFNDNSFTTIPVDPEALVLAKYFRNAYLATKVNFFNQIQDLCIASGVNANSVLDIVASDSRIGESHTTVSDERGFGGHCFPKDTSAILKTGELFDVDLSIIREAVEYNKKVRKHNV
jgi:UDPglucose 6-dehydrogenase